MREERFFIEHIGDSLNVILGHPKGHHIYRGSKKKIGQCVMVAGAHHLAPFTRPIEFWFRPRVAPGHNGRIAKAYDAVNFACTYKAIEDTLVQAGVLANDNPEWVHAVHCLRAEPAMDGIPGIEVVIREVDAPAIGRQEGLELEEAPAF